MIRESINTLAFKKVDIKFGERVVLGYSTFDFPTNTSCRFLFQDDIQKYFFFNAISQIHGFQRGEFLFNGENVLDFSFEEFIKYRLNMGFGFSTRGLLQNRTLKENIMLPIKYHHMMPEKEASDWVEYLFDYFRITKDMNLRRASTAASTQKAALIVRAFVHKPELVILDAPEALLSRKVHASLLQMVEEFRRDHGLKHLYFATQDEDLSDCLADTSVLLTRNGLKTVDMRRKIEVAA